MLTVTATATRELPAERAEWQLVVRATDPSPREAFVRCTERLNALAEALRSAGEVSTGGVEVSVDRPGDARARHIAYATLIVAGPVERAGVLAEAAMGAGADEIRGPQLQTADTAALEDELLAEAIRAARRRAQAMAAAAGRSLGAAVAVSDGHDGHQPVWRAAAGPVVEPGPRTVRAAVKVTFELWDDETP